MSFLREQQIKLARRLLAARYESRGIPPPPPATLLRQAAGVVDEAGRIARRRGRNLLAIVKDLINDAGR